MTTIEDYPRRSSLLRSSLVVVGLPLLAAIVFVDSYALRAQRGDATDWQVFGSYAVFVGQTALLSAIVGWRVRDAEEFAWWGILAWGVLLVDLQIFAIAAPDMRSTANTVGFAFASAQIAALICFGLLDDTAWQIRLSLTFVGIGCAVFFAFSMNAADVWYLVLTVQCAGAGIGCAVMRRCGFRIEQRTSTKTTEARGSYAQFSIRHLFYWTTAVAILVAFGRFVSWRSLIGSGTYLDELLGVLVFGPTLTLISMLGMWAALGREMWLVRLAVALVGLPGTGALLGAFVVWSNRRGRWTSLFPVAWATRETFEIGIVWTILAGGMLAGLLLVLATSGHRMGRRKSAAPR